MLLELITNDLHTLKIHIKSCIRLIIYLGFIKQFMIEISTIPIPLSSKWGCKDTIYEIIFGIKVQNRIFQIN